MQDLIGLGAAMLATGCVAGVLAGLFGIGGGIVIVPVLETALGILDVDPAIRMHVAVATSLATIVPTSVSSARAHHARQSVDWDIVHRWWILVLLGSALGSWFASLVDGSVLAVIFATLALLIALKMTLMPESRSLRDAVPRAPWVPVIPTAIGTLSSMMGIGGGTFSVMTLTLFGVPIHKAIGTAALFGLAISLPGTLGFIVTGWADPRLPAGSFGYVSLIGFVLIAPTTFLTAPIGARIAHAFSAKKLNRVFGMLLVVASVRLFYRALA